MNEETRLIDVPLYADRNDTINNVFHPPSVVEDEIEDGIITSSGSN
jgi:hypothetical protein